jgi:hypothetical protein
MDDAAPTLGQLLDRALTEDWSGRPLPRIRQIRSHLTRYASWLGYALKECPAHAYYVSEDRRQVLIEDKAGDYSASYRKNIPSGQKSQTARHPWLAHFSCRQHIPQGGLMGGDAVSLLGGLAPKRGRTVER